MTPYRTPRRTFGGAFGVLFGAFAALFTIPFARAAPQGTGEIIVARDVKIGMRTGAPLLARIFRPPGKTLRPAIFSLETDTSAAREQNARALAIAGYAVVLAAPRAGDDDKHTGRDGYDAVEWINDQPWSDRRIVMTGTGEGASAAWNTAREHPPRLDAILARTTLRPLGWSPTDLARLTIVSLTVTGAFTEPQGTAVATYSDVVEGGGAAASGAFIVIGSLSETAEHLLEFEWFNYTLGGGSMPDLVRKHVNYMTVTDSTWHSADSFAAIGALPTSFPLHTDAGPRAAPGGFLGGGAQDAEPADTIPLNGKTYQTLLGAPLDVAGRTSATLWFAKSTAGKPQLTLEEVRRDGSVVLIGTSAGAKFVPPKTNPDDEGKPAVVGQPVSDETAERWDFPFEWAAARLEAGSFLRLTVRAPGAVLRHDIMRYSRLILQVVRAQK